MTQFVFGLEGDVDGSSYSGWGQTLGTVLASTRENIAGSVRGRLGYAWDRFLIYGTGGATFASIEDGYSVPINNNPGFSVTKSHVGWTAGGGVEYAINHYISARIEYRHSEYSHYTDVSYSATNTHKQSDNKVQVGFNFRFDVLPSGPVLARY